MRYICLKKRSLLLSALALAAVTIMSICLGAGGYAGVYLGVSGGKRPIENVEAADKKVAVTFNVDSAGAVDGIIAELAESGVQATFFVTGVFAVNHPDAVKKIDGAGFEIGTHSNTYPHMSKLTESQMRLELEASARAIKNITEKEVSLFRPPYGEYSDKTLRVAEGMGFTTVQHDVDARSFADLLASQAAGKVVAGTSGGSIILLDAEAANTLAALPAVIAGLKNKGFELVTVGAMLGK